MVDMYIKTDIERQNRNRAIDPFFEICRRILFERLKFYIYKKFGWLYEKTLKRKKIFVFGKNKVFGKIQQIIVITKEEF